MTRFQKSTPIGLLANVDGDANPKDLARIWPCRSNGAGKNPVDNLDSAAAKSCCGRMSRPHCGRSANAPTSSRIEDIILAVTCPMPTSVR